MSLLYCAGRLGNLFTRGTVTCSPAEDSSRPLVELYGDSPHPFAFGSLGADSCVQLRNNCLANPGAESALGAEWVDASSGGGTFARSAVDAGRGGAGTYAFVCDGNAGGIGAGYQLEECPAGELLRLDGWCKPGLAETGSLRVFCEETGLWWVGGWQADEGDAVAVTNEADWTQFAETLLQAPSMGDALSPTVHIRVYMRSEDDADFDDIALVPAVNGAAAFGINWGPRLTPELRYSDDEFVADDHLAAAFALAHPSCYAYTGAPIYREWWRWKLAGTDREIPRAAEGWIGYFQVPSVGPPGDWKLRGGQIVAKPEDPHGTFRDRTAEVRPTSIEMDFTTWDGSEWRAFLNDVDERTYGGHGPLILVPSTVALEARVLYCRPDPRDLELVRSGLDWRQALTVHGMRFPIRTT